MAFIIKAEDRRKLTSPLCFAPLDRARDMLLLAQMGNMASQRAWNDYAAQDPGNARLVRKWVQAENAERANATAVADKFLAKQEMVTKAAAPVVTKKAPYGTCLRCGGPLKKSHPRCKGCGKRSPLYRGEGVSKKRSRTSYKAGVPVLTKAQRSDVLTKASGARWPVHNEYQAVGAMLADMARNDPDPGTRMAAAAALKARAA